MFGGMFGGFAPGGYFEAHYRCYPVSFIEKAEAERGDKIFLPPSALNRLAQLHIEYPMLFKAENRRGNKYTHCGVLEFIADEGTAYLPYWMMQNLDLQEGEVVTLKSTSLPKGSYVKLQPHSKEFLDISNPRAVLETALRNFSCLTAGDVIPIYYNNKTFWINIMEAKPENAISVIETDCNVDFAPPLDYVEPSMTPASTSISQTSEIEKTESAEESKESEKSFLAFAGTGHRLDGKTVTESNPVPIKVESNKKIGFPEKEEETKVGSAPEKKKSGKLMFKDRLAAKFGKDDKSTIPKPAPAKPSEPKKEEEGKGSFKAFQGTSYTLK